VRNSTIFARTLQTNYFFTRRITWPFFLERLKENTGEYGRIDFPPDHIVCFFNSFRSDEHDNSQRVQRTCTYCPGTKRIRLFLFVLRLPSPLSFIPFDKFCSSVWNCQQNNNRAYDGNYNSLLLKMHSSARALRRESISRNQNRTPTTRSTRQFRLDVGRDLWRDFRKTEIFFSTVIMCCTTRIDYYDSCASPAGILFDGSIFDWDRNLSNPRPKKSTKCRVHSVKSHSNCQPNIHKSASRVQRYKSSSSLGSITFYNFSFVYYRTNKNI